MSEPTKEHWGKLKEDISKVARMENDATIEVFEILDEALEEFPVTWIYDHVTDTYTPNPISTIYLKDWFEKWFINKP
jgi:hypothetical protein